MLKPQNFEIETFNAIKNLEIFNFLDISLKKYVACET